MKDKYLEVKKDMIFNTAILTEDNIILWERYGGTKPIYKSIICDDKYILEINTGSSHLILSWNDNSRAQILVFKTDDNPLLFKLMAGLIIEIEKQCKNDFAFLEYITYKLIKQQK